MYANTHSGICKYTCIYITAEKYLTEKYSATFYVCGSTKFLVNWLLIVDDYQSVIGTSEIYSYNKENEEQTLQILSAIAANYANYKTLLITCTKIYMLETNSLVYGEFMYVLILKYLLEANIDYLTYIDYWNFN